MKNAYQLNTRQICLFFIAFLPVTKLFTLPGILAKIVNEDMWLSALLLIILDLSTLIALIFVCKQSNTDFFGLIRLNFGKVGYYIILSLYFIFFMLKAVIPIYEQKDYVDFTLYTLMPTTFYYLPFFAFAFYICTKQLKVLGRASDMLCFVTIIGFIIIISLSVSNADLSALLPVGANGFNDIVKGAFSCASWFGDAVYLLFFIGNFNYKRKDGVKIALSYLASALAVVVFTMIFYSVFTSISFRQRFALNEISKYTTVINNTGRFDYVGILLIMLSNMFAIALPLFFACNILSKIFRLKNYWIAPCFVVGLQLAFSLLFSKYFASIQAFITGYGSVIFILFSNLIPLSCVFLNKKEKDYAVCKG